MKKSIFIHVRGGLIEEILGSADMHEVSVVVVYEGDVTGVPETMLSEFAGKNVLATHDIVEGIDDGDYEEYEKLLGCKS